MQCNPCVVLQTQYLIMFSQLLYVQLRVVKTVAHYYTACGGALVDPVRGSPMFGHTGLPLMSTKSAFFHFCNFSFATCRIS